ncbi:MAG: phosphoribosylaminoimidazolesuccinocarboxamide synthase [Thermoplasmata archaeon]
MKPIKVGKVKEIYDYDSELEFYFTDNISVFDKIIPNKVPNKGASLCRTSEYWFETLKNINIKNHYIRSIGNNRMRVRKFNIIAKPTEQSKDYLIPLEFIVRYYIAGSLFDRLKSGKIKRDTISTKNIEYGAKLNDPFFEVTTKFEKFDRELDIKEAMQISGLNKKELDEIREQILKIDALLNTEVLKRGLIHVDGKKEWALDSERVPVLVDTFGTADEDRFWDLDAYKNGAHIELSKEFVRRYYRETGYYDRLMDARTHNLAEPEIPPMPEDLIRKTSQLYKEMYEKITGRKW